MSNSTITLERIGPMVVGRRDIVQDMLALLSLVLMVLDGRAQCWE